MSFTERVMVIGHVFFLYPKHCTVSVTFPFGTSLIVNLPSPSVMAQRPFSASRMLAYSTGLPLS